MLKKLLTATLLTFLMIPFVNVYGQGVSIVGTVKDGSTGEALPGANILVQELKRGAATDVDGKYIISNISPGTYTLIASFVGYKKSQVTLTVGNEDVTQNFELQPDLLGLEEVTVSALGFQEDPDKSGGSASTVSGSKIEQSGSNELITGLSAKTSGLYITQSGGDPGSGASILIRGQSTITGDNQPLFVIDGMPISNDQFATDINDPNQRLQSVQQQVRSNDINPDDIQSVTVLKGAAAAALWGSRAANGVVVITTKQGRAVSGKAVNVTFKSSIYADEVNKSVPLQTTFGQGSGGLYSQSSTQSWGDKIADRPGGADVMDITTPGKYAELPGGGRIGSIANGTAAQPYGGKNSQTIYDHSKDVFNTGLRYDNSLSISGGSEGSTYYVNVSNLTQNGIIKKNSNYDRTTLRANTDQRLSRDFRVTVNANYIKMVSDRIQQGSNLSGIFLGGLRTPPDFSNDVYLVNYVSPDGTIIPNRQRSYRNPYGQNASPGYDNPNFTINRNTNGTVVNRLIGNTSLIYDPISWLNVTYRIGVDTYSDRRHEYFSQYSGQYNNGSLRKQTYDEFQLNSDLILRASRQLTDDFAGSITLGANINHRELNNVGAFVTNFILPDAPPNLANSPAANRTPFNYKQIIRTAAVYSEIKFDAYNMLFLTLSGRGETASTFGPDASSTFVYPSASLAWQFTELEPLKNNDILSFGKLRASYGQVGRQPGPYLTNTIYTNAATTFQDGWGSGLNPANYKGGYIESNVLGNNELKPERKYEYEFGTDLRFYNDRFGLSATYYYNKTIDAIFGITTASATGFASKTGNVGSIRNKGIELGLNAEWLRLGDFIWTSNVNWSRNLNKVTSLAGTTDIFLNGFASTSSRAVQGYPLGVLWGTPFLRDASGNLILNSNGFPQSGTQNTVIGNPNPDWRMGIGNTFRYKGLSLNVLVDIKQGGKVWNGTLGALYTYGTHKDTGVETTAPQDLKNYAGETIPAGTTFRGRVEDFGGGPVALDQSWYTDLGGGFGPVSEQFIEDGGYVRVREASLTYNWNSEAFRKYTGLSSIDFTLTGRNLFLWTKYKGIDPETNLTGATNGMGLDYFNNPNTRTFIFTLRVNY
ncbi:MAG TPA: SusC/RagA family TonB-linked outer membrane protein [Balneolales bacterium]|nr:SusC/RagA family TonB-linked outer membrane protein [Balneolales bacterium]